MEDAYPRIGFQSDSISDSDHDSHENSSDFGSSQEGSSVSASVLTSSLSSFELAGGKTPSTCAEERFKPPDVRDEDSSNEDCLAEMMNELILNHGQEMSHAFSERVSCIDSIKWLGHHLPESVVAFLVDEIEVEEAGRGAVSDSEIHGFASSSDALDFETSQAKRTRYHDNYDLSMSRLDRDDTIPHFEKASSSFDVNHSGESYRNGEGAIAENDSDGLSKWQENFRFDHNKQQQCDIYFTKNLPINPHDSFVRDESTGYHADFHESRNALTSDCSVQSNSFQFDTDCNGFNFRASRDDHDLIKSAVHSPHSKFFPQRRHSVIGLKTSRTSQVSTKSSVVPVEERKPQRRAQRRSSMPLVVRSIDRHGQHVPSKHRFDDHVSDSSSGGSASSLQFHKQTNDRKNIRRLKRRGSAVSGNSISSLLFEPFKALDHLPVGPSLSCQGFNASIQNVSDDEKREMLRQSRVIKTRDSIMKLSHEISTEMHNPLEDIESIHDGDLENMYFTDAIPPATRHDCALLFVDISGFTKLSTTLQVEPLSKTINNYFQMIVDEVEAFGGDILKFAGDAVFCEWQATTSNPLETNDGISLSGSSQGSIEPWHGLGLEECVLTAATCGARIVDKCSDYPVFDGIGSSGTQVATLNVHCGLGFGEVVGVHVGDRESRMDYVILGDPIEQVADAICNAISGEVVASPDALIILEETSDLDESFVEKDMTKPQVIASKSKLFFKPKGNVQIQHVWSATLQNLSTKPRERLAKRCDDWAMPALTRLRQRMALYVHPVVVNDESAAKIYPGDRHTAQERHRSEAELRDVYTVFIMPLITARLTGDDEEDYNVLVLLNDIMLIMTRELGRFKGHLRQFIVDDKGVVLIANFGLRGSTFPNMVAERAIPFTTTVQTLLKTELKIDCRIGATFGKAYCGVVGGVSRHEYAVLGPSVNLAARLMGNPQNSGFLVDESVKEKAGSRQFRELPPVEAKGYENPVPIFEPLQTPDPIWDEIACQFVGRDEELRRVIAMTDDLLDHGGPAKFLLVTGKSGAGKSALSREASRKIKTVCRRRDVPHLSISVPCNEGDVFVPFSIIRPLFWEILSYLQHTEDSEAPSSDPAEIVDSEEIVELFRGNLTQDDASNSLRHLVQICETVQMPDHFIEILAMLVLTRNRADVVDGLDNHAHMVKLSKIANYVVKALLSCTISFDLVIVSLDEVGNMDEMSWKVVELLVNTSQNMLILATTKHTDKEEMKASEDFWTKLHNEGKQSGQFVELSLEALSKVDIEQLIAKRRAQMEIEIDPLLFSDVFNPEDIPPDGYQQENRKHCNDITRTTSGVAGIDIGNIGEIVLHRMDALPSSVRSHLNLGAILGSAFELMDVITVFEQYRPVTKENRFQHALSVHESLNLAVTEGILEVTNKESAILGRYNASDHPYAEHNTVYKFTHEVWRSNILRLTLDEWKKDMHNLIAQSMETVLVSQPANDYRLLTRLFSHWKGSGRAKEAATLALQMGRNLEDKGLTHQSLIVYRESLDMWKAMDNGNEKPDKSLGGLSVNLLRSLAPSDIEHLIKLNVALGRCYTNILDPVESFKCFQTALNFIHKAPPTSRLDEDRSIIFPVFNGLFFTLRFGQNTNAEYEKGLVEMFMHETQSRNDPVHYSIALAMRAEMLVRGGNITEALDVVEELRDVYDVETHSNRIVTSYGSDRAGQCISQSALWSAFAGRHEEALNICDFVLRDILPKMDPQNVYNSFHILYPIIWVLKSHHRAGEALEAFERVVVQNFSTHLDPRGLTSDRPLHTPIMALLDLVATDCKTDRLEEYAKWALVDQNGRFGTELNLLVGSAGRTADSITAEICQLLSAHCFDPTEKIFFVRKGFSIARDSVMLTRATENSPGMPIAHSQIAPILQELERIHDRLGAEGNRNG